MGTIGYFSLVQNNVFSHTSPDTSPSGYSTVYTFSFSLGLAVTLYILLFTPVIFNKFFSTLWQYDLSHTLLLQLGLKCLLSDLSIQALLSSLAFWRFFDAFSHASLNLWKWSDNYSIIKTLSGSVHTLSPDPISYPFRNKSTGSLGSRPKINKYEVYPVEECCVPLYANTNSATSPSVPLLRNKVDCALYT